MRHAREEPSHGTVEAINMISAVKSIHKLSSHELSKLLRDSENFTIDFVNEKGLPDKIDMEKLASFLPLNLIAHLLSSEKDESLFRYILGGIRLLHSLCDIAPRHTKLEQILLDDVKISEQLLDLVFYLLIILNEHRKDIFNPDPMPFLHSALVACSLSLLTACISSQWPELAQILVAHPKVDMFMEAAFGAVHIVVRFLHNRLYAQHTDFFVKSVHNAETAASYLCQQSEASLQCLQFLCQQKVFRERLIRNKELCAKGGVLYLVQSILKLNITPKFSESSTILASVSRLKAKVLSIMLHLCEAESVSYLDEIASSPRSLDLAKSIALEILGLTKAGLSKDPKHLSASSGRSYPTGLLQQNALRLADVFSDDSNFRSYITVTYTEFLSAIFSLSHGDFVSMWCSTDLPVKEEDATVVYNSFAAAGWVFNALPSSVPNLTATDFSLVFNNTALNSYVHQRTSLFIKIIANLHCHVPEICEAQEKHFFLRKFLDCLQLDPSKSLPGFSFAPGLRKTAAVSRNIRSLVCHAESLLPTYLNRDDMTLIRMFSDDFHSLINPDEFEENDVQEAESLGGWSSPTPRRESLNLSSRNGSLKDEISENRALEGENRLFRRNNHIDQGDDVMEQDTVEDKHKCGTTTIGSREMARDVVEIETSGSDSSPTRVENSSDPMMNKHIKDTMLEGGKVEERQWRKRRSVMNDTQVRIMERALLSEPEMQRNSNSIQSWADELSRHGSEVTCSQLRNWLNNRKVKLSRASKEALAILEAENALKGNQGEAPPQSHDSHNTLNSPGEAGSVRDHPPRVVSRTDTYEPVQWKQDQLVTLVDEQGMEIGAARVQQTLGKWCGTRLDESGKCVVDVFGLQVDRWRKVPYPSEEGSGATFEEAEKRFGVMRVLWDSNKLLLLRP